jgi:hypothetical protein
MSLRGRGLWLIGQLVDELRLAKARPGTLVTLRRRIGDPAATGQLPRWPSGRQPVSAPPWLTTKRTLDRRPRLLCRLVDTEQGDVARAAPSEPGGAAVPEALGILGPIPTIPSGCVVALIAAGADVLSRPCPRLR